MIDTKDFCKERDEALLSLDKRKIDAFVKKYGIQIPQNELTYWASVHKSIVSIKSSTEEQKAQSRAWLINNGFNPYVY